MKEEKKVRQARQHQEAAMLLEHNMKMSMLTYPIEECTVEGLEDKLIEEHGEVKEAWDKMNEIINWVQDNPAEKASEDQINEAVELIVESLHCAIMLAKRNAVLDYKKSQEEG